MRHLTTVSILALRVVLTLCAVGCTRDEEKVEAEQLIERHFEALARHAYSAAIANYADAFFADITRSYWRNSLAILESKLGTFQHYEITSQQPDTRITAGPGRYRRIACRVIYSRYPSDEIFYVFRGTNASKYKIVGHKIASIGLLEK